MKNEFRRHLLEHAKTMACTVQEAYGEVAGRVQETLFQHAEQRPLISGPRRGVQRGFFMTMCALWESLGAPFCEKKVVVFRGLISR